MSVVELNTAKVDLVRNILNETDESVIKNLMRFFSENKSTIEPTKNLASHLGKLKRGIDGLAYQKEIRNEWD